jgi:hypothetical protein
MSSFHLLNIYKLFLFAYLLLLPVQKVSGLQSEMAFAIVGHLGQGQNNFFDVTCRLEDGVRRDKDLQETECGTDDLSGGGSHEEAHVIDQQLRQIVREEVLELVEDSSDSLNKST